MSVRKKDNVAKALNLLLDDANLQLPGAEKLEINQLITDYFVDDDCDSDIDSDTSEIVDLDSVQDEGK